jgi:hypothetical protein
MPTVLRLALLIAALSIGADAFAQASTNRPQALGGGGRFVFGQINEFSADQYLLDTQTGRVWRLVDTADGTASVFEPIRFQLPDGSSQSMPPPADTAPAPTPLPPPSLEEEQ